MKHSVAFYLMCLVGLLGMILYAISPSKVGSIQSCLDIISIDDQDTVSIKRATIYNAVVGQCDDDPFTTADGSHIDTTKLRTGELKWVALSQDLVYDEYKASLHPGLFKGKFEFGDTIRVISKKHTCMNGLYVVRDVMNRRYKLSMDFLQPLKKKYKFGLGLDFKIVKQ